MAFINADKVKTDDLTSLVKTIDKTIEENKGLYSFVCLVGEDRDDLEEKAEKLGKGLKHVAVTVPVEFEAGPKNFGINPEVPVSVMAYKGTKVQTNIATKALDEKTIKAIAEAGAKLVK